MDMNSNNSLSPYEARVRELLGKYFLGLTSMQEEKELHAALSDFPLDRADTALRADAELFLTLASMPSLLPPVPEGFEQELAAHVDALASTSGTRSVRRIIGPRIYAWVSAGVAAAIAGLLFLSPFFTSADPAASGDTESSLMASVPDDYDYGVVEITDPKKAERIVGRSIAMLSNVSRAAARQASGSLNVIGQ